MDTVCIVQYKHKVGIMNSSIHLFRCVDKILTRLGPAGIVSGPTFETDCRKAWEHKMLTANNKTYHTQSFRVSVEEGEWQSGCYMQDEQYI